MSCSEGKTVRVKPSLHMRMEIRIQTNLPLDTLLHSSIQGQGSRIFPWRKVCSRAFSFPVRTSQTFSVPLQCSTEDPSLGVTHLCTRSKRRKIAWKEQALKSKAQMCMWPLPPGLGASPSAYETANCHLKLSDFPKSYYWIRAFGYIKARL